VLAAAPCAARWLCLAPVDCSRAGGRAGGVGVGPPPCKSALTLLLTTLGHLPIAAGR